MIDDWPKGRIAHLLLLAAVYFCSTAFLMQFPRYVMQLGGTAQEAGWLLALGLIPALLLGGPVGDWNRRHGGRWPAVFACVLVLPTHLAMIGFTEINLSFVLLRFIYSIGHSILFVTLFAQAGLMVSHPLRRAQLIGWLSVSIQLGNALGGTLGELAYGQGMTVYWGACAAIGTLALLGALGWRDVASVAAIASAETKNEKAMPASWPIELWAVVAVGMAFSVLSQFLPAFIEQLRSSGELAAPFAAAWFITPALLVVAAVRLFAGWLGGTMLRPGVLLVCHGLLVLSLLAVPGMHSREYAVVTAIVFGLGYGWLYPALNALAVNRATPAQRGRIAGWLVAAFEIGFRLGPVALGIVITEFGYPTMFYSLVLGYCLLLMIAWGHGLFVQRRAARFVTETQDV